MKTNPAKRLYRLLPLSIRRMPAMRRLALKVGSQLLPHNWIYDHSYYHEAVEDAAAGSAEQIAQSILRDLEPRSAVDVGCGTGALLDVLARSGCHTLGLEKSDAGIQYCRHRGLTVQPFDLEKPTQVRESGFDVAISLEVAEHLAPSAADGYVTLLAALSSTVVITAAQPGQGGTQHLNEQPPEYWEEKFRQRAFFSDKSLATRWKHEWQASNKVASWYYENLMVFKRR